MKNVKTNNKGFSLVELIIVIAIMAILIGVLAPQYMKYVEKSRISADTSLLDSIYSACTTAASDPNITDSPAYNASQTSVDNTTDWGKEVLDTLKVTQWSEITAKLKSKAMKGATITIKTDAKGNFSVEVVGNNGEGTFIVPDNSSSGAQSQSTGD